MFHVILLNFFWCPLPLVFEKDTFTKENICDLIQVGDDPEAVAEAEDEHEEDEHHGDVLVTLVPVAVPSCGRALKLKINHQQGACPVESKSNQSSCFIVCEADL